MPYRFCIIIAICLAILISTSYSDIGDIADETRKELPLKNVCLTPREITGCSGTLLENFQPKTTPIGIPDTSFYLFTPLNKDQPEELHQCAGLLPTNTNFNPSVQTMLMVHGYLDGVCQGFFMQEMKDKYFQSRNGNLILVDWSWAGDLDLVSAAHDTRVVGEQIAFVLKNIMKQTRVDPRTFHLIGHSFGAHAAGFAGKILHHIGRITGLDPAGPLFQDNPSTERLDRTDAELVDVIHGNAGPPPNNGYVGTLGHLDFYPNGGSQQPNCLPYVIKELLMFRFLNAVKRLPLVTDPLFCSHHQPREYWKTSSKSCTCQFVGVECPDYESFINGSCRSCGADGSKCAVMGLDLVEYPFKMDRKYHKYFLSTTLNKPHCDDIDLGGFPSVTNVC